MNEEGSRTNAVYVPGELSCTGWTPPADITFEELQDVARQFCKVRGVQWWLGDLVNTTQAKYGEKYKEVAKYTGYNEATLANFATVCRKFSISRRREVLTFSHHVEVLGKSELDADEWLTRAVAQEWSVRQLRDAIERESMLPSEEEVEHGAKRSKRKAVRENEAFRGRRSWKAATTSAVDALEVLTQLIRRGHLDLNNPIVLLLAVELHDELGRQLEGYR